MCNESIFRLYRFSERQDTETSPSGETEDKWEGGMGGRRVSQPGRTPLLRRVLPHPQHHQQNHHQSRPFGSVENDASTRQHHNPRQEKEEKEEDEEDDEEVDAAVEEEVDSQDSNPSSALSVVSARTAAGDEPAEAAAPIGDLERLHAIQRALQAALQTSAVTAATSYL